MIRRAVATVLVGGTLLLAAVNTHVYHATGDWGTQFGAYLQYGSVDHGACHLIGFETTPNPGFFSGDIGWGPIEQTDC